MRLTATFVIGLTMTVTPALAQDDGHALRVVLHDTIRTMKPGAYQGRNSGPEQTERFFRKVKIGRDGRLSVSNIAGDIVVTTGSGDEVSIEAVKKTRGDKSELANVQITVDDRAGRIDIRTEHEQNRRDRSGRSDHVSVDYTITVPASVSVDLHSISGGIKVTGVHGSLRSETISGNVAITDAPKLEAAKTVSGDVTLNAIATDGDITASSVSGSVKAKGLKARGVDVGSVSGDIDVSDATCERLGVKTVSGNVEYGGTIVKGGRYEINAHSGTIRLLLSNPAGFELNANSFSGSIRSELPMTINADTSGRSSSTRGRPDSGNNHSMRATFGDGSATVVVRTFSGDVIIARR